MEVTQIHYENGLFVGNTCRKASNIFYSYNHPSETAIKKLMDKFQSTGSVHNISTTTTRVQSSHLA